MRTASPSAVIDFHEPTIAAMRCTPPSSWTPVRSTATSTASLRVYAALQPAHPNLLAWLRAEDCEGHTRSRTAGPSARVWGWPRDYQDHGGAAGTWRSARVRRDDQLV